MLPDWMIEKLEQDRRAREERERPRLELEIPRPEQPASPATDDSEPKRGVVMIEIL
jgi:hypothetical protein